MIKFFKQHLLAYYPFVSRLSSVHVYVPDDPRPCQIEKQKLWYNYHNMLPPEAKKKRMEIIRKMPGEKRLKITFDLNNLIRKIMEDGIKYQQPGISPEELNKQISFRMRK